MFAPLVLALILWVARPRHPRQFAACLVSFLWAAPALLLLQVLNQWADWWTFAPGSVQLRGMPVELWVGWNGAVGGAARAFISAIRNLVVGCSIVGAGSGGDAVVLGGCDFKCGVVGGRGCRLIAGAAAGTGSCKVDA